MYDIQNMNCMNCVLIGLIVITLLSLWNKTLNRTKISEVSSPNKILVMFRYSWLFQQLQHTQYKSISEVWRGLRKPYPYTLGARETVSDRPSTQRKLLTGSSSNSMSQSCVIKKLTNYKSSPWSVKKQVCYLM